MQRFAQLDDPDLRTDLEALAAALLRTWKGPLDEEEKRYMARRVQGNWFWFW